MTAGQLITRHTSQDLSHDTDTPPAGSRVLIVESQPELGWMWKRHLDRSGCVAHLVHGEDAAIEYLRHVEFDVIVLNLMLRHGSAFAVSDFANYRQPEARVVFVTNSSFFADGSIFRHSANACAMIPSDSSPEDLAAVVEHYGATRYA